MTRTGRAPWEADPLEMAWSVVQTTFEEADQALEARVTEWLAQDPEHWPIFRLVVLDPWQEQPGQWRKDAPGWVRSSGRTRRSRTSNRIPMGGNAWSTGSSMIEGRERIPHSIFPRYSLYNEKGW